MGEIFKPQVKTYWIAYSDDKKTIHWGITEPDHVTTSGQKNFECNISKDILIKRLTELNIKTKIYDKDDIEIAPSTLIMDKIVRTVYFDKEMKEVDIFTATKVELSKAEDGVITKIINTIIDGAIQIIDGITWVWDSIIGWFKN